MSQTAPEETKLKYFTRVGVATGTALVVYATTLDARKAALEAERVSDAMKGGQRSWGSGRTQQEKEESGQTPDQREQRWKLN